jgi:hypothetical protein
LAVLPLKTIVLLPVFDTGAIHPFVRLFSALCATLLFSSRLLAGAGSLDSLPSPVQNTLQALLQDPKAAVGGVEIDQWGVGLAYKVIITRDGQPYLEVHIGDSGQLVRCEPIPQTSADDKDKHKNKEDGSGNDDRPGHSSSP